MTEPETQRLFFALWPDERQRRQMEEYFALLRGCGGRRVHTENLHITLAFLGSVDTETHRCMERAADAISLPSFSVTLDRLGFWRRPRVVWLGNEETPAGLAALVAELKKAMLGCSLEPDSRAFRTHLTLMRKARRYPRVPEVPVLEWPVKSFALVASETSREGVIYKVLRSWELG
ncbi:MAG: RNA 2',3'-cyclic phosphodiesterase [Pseudomonadota bacterium]